MAGKLNHAIDLGYAEKIEDSWRLLSHYFPSKLGGSPAWLSLHPIPDFEKLQCQNCSKICQYLLQLYSPIETNPAAFHRSLFVFVCTNALCPKREFKVFRSQLPRINSFYSHEPPDDSQFKAEEKHPKASDYNKLCNVCGCLATKSCAKCSQNSYCCKDHQIVAWKNGHKQECVIGDVKTKDFGHIFGFEEHEIVIEPEEFDADDQQVEQTTHYQKYLNAKNKLSSDILSEKDLESIPAMKVKDEAFLHFNEVISHNPTQIIRYHLGGQPLLVSNESCVPKIPPCENCGSIRQFEFQVMPQTLNYLHLDSAFEDTVDWGTLLVYTCTMNCSVEGYVQEFMWKQDFSKKNVVE